MHDEEYETTIGTGGWVLVVLAGLVTFGVFGVLLGSGGVERAEFDDHGSGHGHGHH